MLVTLGDPIKGKNVPSPRDVVTLGEISGIVRYFISFLIVIVTMKLW